MLEKPIITTGYDKVLILFLVYGSAYVNILSEWDHFRFEGAFINKEAMRKSYAESISEKCWITTGLCFV